jgi:hypothetical protein
MKRDSSESIVLRDCPPEVAQELAVAGGLNRFGEPNFRVVWGYNRIVPMTGEWQEWEHSVAKLTDKLTGFSEQRPFIRLVRSVVETRQEPKYLPANCWHLEKWCPPEDYGSPDLWRKQGEEVVQGLTVDTAGEFPSRGEYELVMPLTTDFTCMGKPLPLEGVFAAQLVNLVRAGQERFSMVQRKAAIEQRLQREDQGFTRRAIDIMKDGLRPYAGEAFVTVPEATPGEVVDKRRVK